MRSSAEVESAIELAERHYGATPGGSIPESYFGGAIDALRWVKEGPRLEPMPFSDHLPIDQEDAKEETVG